MGFGPRSHREAAYVVAESFDAECVVLELSNPSFYHLDTAFCPLPSGDVIYYPGAFAESGLRAIEERVAPEHRVAIDREETARFAANAVPLNGSIVLSSCSERLRRGARICRGRDPAPGLLAQWRLGLLPDFEARPSLSPREWGGLEAYFSAPLLPRFAGCLPFALLHYARKPYGQEPPDGA
jgi:hypothetical protein